MQATVRRFAAAIAVPLVLVVSSGVLTACQKGTDCDAVTFVPGADLSGTDLRGKQLQQCDLTGANLTGANLTGADLSNAILRNVDLDGADLTTTELNQADLKGASIDGTLLDADLYFVSSGDVTGTPAALPALWTLTDGYLVGPSANLAGAQFFWARDFAGRDLSYANLTGAWFYAVTDLTGANFDQANLTGTYFMNSKLTGSTGPGNGTSASSNFYDFPTCSDGFVGDCNGHGPGW